MPTEADDLRPAPRLGAQDAPGASPDMEPRLKPPPRTGLSHIGYAFIYSISGLAFAFRHETAFKQEVFLCGSLSIAALLLPVSELAKLVLLSSHFAVMVVELLNTSIECVVDKVSPEFHELAKRAKDLGSAAVMLSIVFLALCWGVVLIQIFSGRAI